MAACQLGITLASIGLGVVGEAAFETLLNPVLGAEAKVAGVAVAATCARAHHGAARGARGARAQERRHLANRGDVTAHRGALRLFYLATKPVVDAFNGLGNLVLRPFGIPPAREVATRRIRRVSCWS